MPARTKKEEEILFFSSLVENNPFGFFFLNWKYWGRLQISHGAQLWGRGVHINTTSSFECPLRWHFCLFSFISMHHNGFTKSFACCLSCESCLCAQCQMPGQGRWCCWDGEVRWGSETSLPSTEVPLYSQWPGENSAPKPPLPNTTYQLPLPPPPPGGEQNLGRILF